MNDNENKTNAPTAPEAYAAIKPECEWHVRCVKEGIEDVLDDEEEQK